METLSELDKMAASLLGKMPDILSGATEYGGDLFLRFIQYAIVIESTLLLIPFLMFIAVSIFATKTFKKYKKKGDDFCDTLDNSPFLIPLMVFTVTALMVAASMFFCTLFTSPNIFEAIFLPELYVIKYF